MSLVKRKYSKIVISMVLDGRNQAIRESKTDGIQEAMNAYCVVGGYSYEPQLREVTPPGGKSSKRKEGVMRVELHKNR